MQIETAWRQPKEQRPGALQKKQYRELDVPDNPDAEPPCPSTKSALIVFGRHVGKTLTICTDDNCPVHNPAIAAQIAKHQAENPAPVMAPAAQQETEEEAEQRKAEFAQRRKEYEEKQQRLEEQRAAERKAEFDRQQKEYEAETKQREKQHKARLATLERIIEHAPASFEANQLRLTIELLLNLSTYGLFEEAAEHFVGDDENHNKTEDEILAEALANTADDKLMGFFLRLLLTEQVASARRPARLAGKGRGRLRSTQAEGSEGEGQTAVGCGCGVNCEEEHKQEESCLNSTPHSMAPDTSGAFLFAGAGRTRFGFSRTCIPLALRPPLAWLRGRKTFPLPAPFPSVPAALSIKRNGFSN